MNTISGSDGAKSTCIEVKPAKSEIEIEFSKVFSPIELTSINHPIPVNIKDIIESFPASEIF